MADVFTKEKRSEVMSRIRSKDTKIEVMVRKWLFAKGFRFRKNDRRYPGTPDIVLPKYRTAIFINGCFWHGHQGCKYFKMPKNRHEYWQEKIDRNRSRDEEKVKALEADGWNVITIWECELRKDPEVRLNRLLDEITSNCIMPKTEIEDRPE